MVSMDRQRVIETNRSLRLIKNELEALLEKGIIDDSAFDSINRLLPTEASISASQTPAQRSQGLPTPASPPTSAMNNLGLQNAGASTAPAPPSYAQSTGNSTASSGGPPPLPGRATPAAPPPSKPVIAHAKALYKYAASDARDCSFDRGDRIAIYEYMNADWWMGRNLRTGQEGIFPKSYVEPEMAAAPVPTPAPAPAPWQAPVNNGGWNSNEKQGGYPGAGYQAPPQPQYGAGAYPPPPGPQNPYNAQAPPMAVAEQQPQDGGSKMGEHGKKFGKKLGNAAIFGAGATIGSNLVNSIF